jgi:hypothetical protein
VPWVPSKKKQSKNFSPSLIWIEEDPGQGREVRIAKQSQAVWPGGSLSWLYFCHGFWRSFYNFTHLLKGAIWFPWDGYFCSRVRPHHNK